MSVYFFLDQVAEYYTKKIARYGATAKGVDWNSLESQQLRFLQLMKVTGGKNSFSITDYGCGYGALFDYLNKQDLSFQYFGFDISNKMISHAQSLFGANKQCKFYSQKSSLPPSDYTVASGIFNVKLQSENEEWKEYILHMLEQMAELSSQGFAFNALTQYSDPDRMRPDLYYADPTFLFDYCKKTFSKYVSLLHDYPLFEFTILVRL